MRPTARLAGSRTTVERIGLDDLKLDLLELSDRLEQAEAELFSARHEIQAVADRPARLNEWAQELERAESEQRKRADTTGVRFAAVITPHGPQSWRWAVDHVDTALGRLDRAVATSGTAATAIPDQDWATAGAQLEAAGLELNAADALFDELDTLMVDLEQARLECPGMMRAAAQELSELRSFVASKSTDLAPEFHLNPERVQEVLEEMGRELTKQRPNYLRVARTLDRVDRQMDQMLAESQEEAKRIEALRRELATGSRPGRTIDQTGQRDAGLGHLQQSQGRTRTAVQPALPASWAPGGSARRGDRHR